MPTIRLMYTARVVIGSDGGSGQNLKFYIDSDRDGDFADETTLLNTDVIDNDWSTGCVGLFRAQNDTTAHQFDDFKVGYDNNADGDVDDGGDDVQIDDNFDSGAITLAHDDAGNLTDDGVFLYVYDAWNRLVKVTRRLDAFTTVAEYEYDGLDRRIRKVVSNCGDGLVPGSDDLDGNGTPDATGIPFANRSEHYYLGGVGVSPVNRRILEERDNNGSAGRVLAQTVYGTEYIDEPVCRDRNIDVSTDSTPAADDCLDGSGGTTGSTRYFYHQDANYRVAALTNESGTVVERYEYEAYGEPRVHVGQPAGGTYESGALVSTSYVGNPLMHQGLRRDDETGLHENRHRMLHSRLGRFEELGVNSYDDLVAVLQQRVASGKKIVHLEIIAHGRGGIVIFPEGTGLNKYTARRLKGLIDRHGTIRLVACYVFGDREACEEIASEIGVRVEGYPGRLWGIWFRGRWIPVPLGGGLSCVGGEPPSVSFEETMRRLRALGPIGSGEE